MNGRYRHLIGNKILDILEGQIWIRSPKVTKINNPLNIEIIAEPDGEEERFYVKNLSNGSYLFFYRDDIVNNYEKKAYTGPIDINEQIFEIMGGRNLRDAEGNRLHVGPGGDSEIPDFWNTPKLADNLLKSLSKYSPKIKVRMGKYTLYLDKPYSGNTREEAICKAWIEKNI